MTRKHFEALAAAIAEISDDDERRRTANLIADVCQGFSVLFDKRRFYTACNVKVDPRD